MAASNDIKTQVNADIKRVANKFDAAHAVTWMHLAQQFITPETKDQKVSLRSEVFSRLLIRLRSKKTTAADSVAFKTMISGFLSSESSLTDYQRITLGMCYCFGVGGVAKNPQQAFIQFEKAAKSKNSYALLWLAICYRDSIGVALNPQQSLTTLDAIIAEEKQSGERIGFVYAMKGKIIREKEAKQAVDCYLTGVELCEGEAMVALGKCHGFGKGTDVDHKRAIEQFEHAAEYGVLGSLSGYAYFMSGVSKQDLYECFVKEVDYGSAASAFDAGKMLSGKFVGIKKDSTQAAAFFRLASLLGPQCAKEMDALYKREPQDFSVVYHHAMLKRDAQQLEELFSKDQKSFIKLLKKDLNNPLADEFKQQAQKFLDSIDGVLKGKIQQQLAPSLQTLFKESGRSGDIELDDLSHRSTCSSGPKYGH